MKKVLSLILIMVLMVGSLMVGCTAKDESTATDSSSKKPVVLQFAHPVSEDSNTHRLGLKFKEELESISEGEITVQVLPNFAGERELLESLQRGDVGLTLTSAAPLVNFEPRMAVFDVPFLFKSKETPQATMESVFKVFDTPEVKSTLQYLEENNLKGLGYLGLGFRVLATNKVVATTDDLSGLKIRTMENKNHIAAWKALGANPTPMAFTEVFTALEQGTIDGQEQPFDILNSHKFYEVLSVNTNVDMIFNTTVLSMSKPIFDSLTKEQQDMVIKAADNAVAYARQDAIEGVSTNIQSLLDNGMVINDISPEEKAVFLEKVQSVVKDIRAEIGDEIVDIFQAAVEAN